MKRLLALFATFAFVLASCGTQPEPVEQRTGALLVSQVFVAKTGAAFPQTFIQQVPLGTAPYSCTPGVCGARFEFGATSNVTILSTNNGTVYPNGENIPPMVTFQNKLVIGPTNSGYNANHIACGVANFRTVRNTNLNVVVFGTPVPNTGFFPSSLPGYGLIPGLPWPNPGTWGFSNPGANQGARCHDANAGGWSDRDATVRLVWFPNSNTGGLVPNGVSSTTVIAVRIDINFPEYGVTNRYFFYAPK